MKKINNFLNQRIIKILSFFLLIQPFLDVITSFFLNTSSINITIGIIARCLFLCLIIYYLIFISRNKWYKYNFIYLIIEFLYLIIFTILTVINKGCNSLMYELTNAIKTFYFPTILIGFINIVIDKKQTIDIKVIGKTFIIYFLFLIIPILTNTYFYAYQEQIGSIGWFNSSNEISGILSIMLPLIFYIILEHKNILIRIFSLIGILIILFTISTKTPILAYIITLFAFICYYLFQLIKEKKYKRVGIIISTLLIFLISIILLFPKTPVYDSIKTRLDFFDIKGVNDIFSSKENFDIVVFSSRLKFLNQTKLNFDKSSIYEKIFGIGYIENYGKDQVNIKMIEMDYFDIFYRHGIVGFVIYFLPLTVVLINQIRNFMKKKKNKIDFALALSITLSIFLALLTGHILVSPAVSIWVSTVLSILYFNLEVVKK